MRKRLIFVLAGMMLAAVASGAFAAPIGVATGEGKNTPCDEPPPDYCPHPVDPTDDDDAQALRVAVAIGDEGQENSVGRVGVAASEEDGLQVYGEDYTDGDVIAEAVEDIDRVTGCALFPPDPEEDQDCAVESDDDTVLITVHPSETTHADPSADADCADTCAEELAIARTATEKYRNVAVALANGYIPTSGCATAEDEGEDPSEGVMGIHFTDVERDGNDSFDQILDVREPEMLLYVPDAMTPGGLRLVAIEYSAPALVKDEQWRGPHPPPEDVQPAPELFDHVFDGPMRGHDPLELQPWHYDLHVWAWSDNPNGTFAHFNPREDCDPTTSPANESASTRRLP